MLFDACDAEKISAWKGEIESTIESMDSLKDEILDYFATNGEHEPPAVLAAWDSIQTINQGDILWGAFTPDSQAKAEDAAQKAGLTLHYGTPANGYGNANWDGMTLWFVQ